MGRAEAERLRQPFVSRHRREPGPADDAHERLEVKLRQVHPQVHHARRPRRRAERHADDDLAVGRDDASPRLDVKRRRRALGRELVLERERRLRVEGPYERTSGWS